MVFAWVVSLIMKQFWLIAVIVVAAYLNGISAAPAAASLSALKLTQTHYYWGDTETIVSLQGVRINNRGRMHYVLVAGPPAWTVTIYREDDKICFVQNFADFQISGPVSNFLFKKQDRIQGAGTALSLAKIDGITIKQTQNLREAFAYLPLGNFAAPQVEKILYAVYKQPTNGGIPILFKRKLKGRDWMTGLDTDGSERVYISTKKIERITVPSNYFEAPSGYRKTLSVQEALMSKMSRESAGDVDEIFDIGSPKKKTGP